MQGFLKPETTLGETYTPDRLPVGAFRSYSDSQPRDWIASVFILCFPAGRQIDARAGGIEHERFGKPPVLRQFGRAAGRPGGKRRLRGALYVFHLHAEVVDAFATIACRQNR